MENNLNGQIVANIRKIMRDKNLKQAAVAGMLEIHPSQFTKVLKGEVQLSLKQVSNLATNLSISVIDLLTYPDVYVPNTYQPSKTKVLVELEVSPDEFIRMGLKEKVIQVLDK